MSPKFEYFHWATPDSSRPLFGLYDAFDNHLVILSYSYQNIYTLKQLIRSKVILEIVELTGTKFDIDNSVVENWGLSNPSMEMYGDVRSLTKPYTNIDLYYEMIVKRDPALIPVTTTMDTFKVDLQKQIFFFNFCIEQLSNNKQHTLDARILEMILGVAELSESYDDAVDCLLNLNYASTIEKLTLMVDFLRKAGLFYE